MSPRIFSRHHQEPTTGNHTNRQKPAFVAAMAVRMQFYRNKANKDDALRILAKYLRCLWINSGR
jgi:hypothetical protein